jgi:hypothetical protein
MRSVQPPRVNDEGKLRARLLLACFSTGGRDCNRRPRLIAAGTGTRGGATPLSRNLRLFGQVRIAREKPVRGRHDLATLQSWWRTINFLSSERALPREAACEGAGDDFGDHSHIGVFAFPGR